MEGKKKVLVMEAMALVLLASFLVAFARQSSAGLRLLGKRPAAKSELVCCDMCECGDHADSPCFCGDTMDGDCADGCQTCSCEDAGNQLECRCLDDLETCPDSCSSDYVVKKSPEKNKRPVPAGYRRREPSN